MEAKLGLCPSSRGDKGSQRFLLLQPDPEDEVTSVSYGLSCKDKRRSGVDQVLVDFDAIWKLWEFQIKMLTGVYRS